MTSYESKIEFFKRLIDGVENANHAAEQAMDKAYQALHPDNCDKKFHEDRAKILRDLAAT